MLRTFWVFEQKLKWKKTIFTSTTRICYILPLYVLRALSAKEKLHKETIERDLKVKKVHIPGLMVCLTDNIIMARRSSLFIQSRLA